MEAGIIPISQYTWLFILSINPIIFKFFKKEHFWVFGLGFLLSFVNARAILPFLLIILLDLDLTDFRKEDKIAMIVFTGLQLFVFFAFGSASHV